MKSSDHSFNRVRRKTPLVLGSCSLLLTTYARYSYLVATGYGSMNDQRETILLKERQAVNSLLTIKKAFSEYLDPSLAPERRILSTKHASTPSLFGQVRVQKSPTRVNSRLQMHHQCRLLPQQISPATIQPIKTFRRKLHLEVPDRARQDEAELCVCKTVPGLARSPTILQPF